MLLQTKFLMITGLSFFLSLALIAFLTFYQMSEIINNRLIFQGNLLSMH